MRHLFVPVNYKTGDLTLWFVSTQVFTSNNNQMKNTWNYAKIKIQKLQYVSNQIYHGTLFFYVNRKEYSTYLRSHIHPICSHICSYYCLVYQTKHIICWFNFVVFQRAIGIFRNDISSNAVNGSSSWIKISVLDNRRKNWSMNTISSFLSLKSSSLHRNTEKIARKFFLIFSSLSKNLDYFSKQIRRNC